MVVLHILIAEIPFPRVTIDADTIGDVRARLDATRIAAAALVNSGWTADGVDNIIHRFTSEGGGVVDILGPDGLKKGPTTVPPATTLLVPGGTQLLNRSAEVVLIIRSTGETIHDLRVPLPSRLAALIGKSAAPGLPDGRDRHLLTRFIRPQRCVLRIYKNRFPKPIADGFVA